MPNPPDTRESLIQRLPNGADSDAWQQFLDIYEPLLYRLGTQRGLQPADAEDFVQEVLTAVAKSIEQWTEDDSDRPFRAWLFRIASNLSVNFLTRRKHQRLGDGGSNAQRRLEELPAPAGEEPSEFELEYRRELFRWAAERVRSSVSRQVWTAFWHTAICEKPIKQVASDLGMSVGAVYVARSRMSKRIAELIQRHSEQTQ